MSKSRAMTRWLSIPNEVGEGEGTALVYFCIPNTRGWRGNATKVIKSLSYGRNYNEEDGSVRGAVSVGKEIFETMAICDFQEIIDAISAIQITNNITVTSSGSDCGCAGPSGAPSDPAEEGETPPEGWEPATDDEGNPLDENSEEYQDRKCRMSWAVQLQIEGLLQKMVDAGFDDVLAAFGAARFALASAMIGYIIGELSTPFPILDGLAGSVIGFVAGLVVKLLIGGVDISSLNDSVVANRDDLVCALWTSTSSLAAINDYLQVLADDGVSLANREVIGGILITDVVNLIFFKSSKLSQALEDAVENASLPICDCECVHTVGYGVIDSDDGSTIQGSSVFTEGFHRFSVKLCANIPDQSYEISGINTLSGTIVNAGGLDAYRIWSPESDFQGDGDVYSSDSPPGSTQFNCKAIAFTSTSAFSVEYDYLEEV